ATASPEIWISPTSLFGIRRFSSKFRHKKRSRSFRLLLIGSAKVVRSAVLSLTTEKGSTLLRARNISTCTAEICEKNGSPVSSAFQRGQSAWPNQRLLIARRSCAAAQLSENIAESARKRSSRTRFCGRAHKLLPKVSFTVVLSAPKKRSAASIATSTSKSNQ